MMMGHLNEEATKHDTRSDELVEGEDGDGELYRLEVRNGTKVFTKPRDDSIKGNTKGGGKGRTDKECFRCGRIGHTRADCRAKTHRHGGPPKAAPKGKGIGSCEEEEQETSQNVPLGTIDLGSFEVLSDHGDTEEDGEESSFFDCQDEQSDVLQQADPWARNAPNSLSSAKGCTSVNFLACSVCQQLPITALQCDISSKGEG